MKQRLIQIAETADTLDFRDKGVAHLIVELVLAARDVSLSADDFSTWGDLAKATIKKRGDRVITLVPLRRPKGKVSVQLSTKEDGDIFKDRAAWLLEAMGAYYSHRAGHCLTPQRAEWFVLLYDAGFEASRRHLPGDKTPYTFARPDDLLQYTLKQAVKLVKP